MTNELTKQNFAAVLRAARVMPIMTVHDVKQALLTAEAIARGGLTVMEITLRTEVAVRRFVRFATKCRRSRSARGR